MLIGIVCDIHCNHEALRIALERMGAVDELLCAGDAVYQFRFSNEVMEILRERERATSSATTRRCCSAGGASGRAPPTGCAPTSSRTWRRSSRALEATVDGKRLVMVHGSPFEPHNEYIYPNSPSIAGSGTSTPTT